MCCASHHDGRLQLTVGHTIPSTYIIICSYMAYKSDFNWIIFPVRHLRCISHSSGGRMASARNFVENVNTWGWFPDKICDFPPIHLRCHTALRSSGRPTNAFCLFDMRAIKPCDGDIIATHYIVWEFLWHFKLRHTLARKLETIYSDYNLFGGLRLQCTLYRLHPSHMLFSGIIKLWWKVILMLTELCATALAHTNIPLTNPNSSNNTV